MQPDVRHGLVAATICLALSALGLAPVQTPAAASPDDTRAIAGDVTRSCYLFF